MESYLKSLPENFELYEFKLERVLGQGGFGITYLAFDSNLMQHVAIKEYYPRECASRDGTFTIHADGNAEDRDTFAWGLKRFLDEARVLAQMSHPNIISIKRFFEANGTAYLVMEYCDGKPLDELIRDHGPLKESELSSILYPLLDGLEHVHQKDFLHRDIKPANIFIKRNGSPVLLDFGASKHEMTSYSKSVTSLATAGYAPFEQYSTKGKQGTWSDIYGLAATIYRAISGIKPQDAAGRMLDDTLVPAAEMLKGKFSANLLIALDKALSVRPDARPQTIAEFRSLINGRPDESPTQKSSSALSDSKRIVPEGAEGAPAMDTRESRVSGPVGDTKQVQTTVYTKLDEENSNYLVILSVIVIILVVGAGWFLLGTSETKSPPKTVDQLVVESKTTEVKVTPLVVESIPSTPASTIKPAPVASDAKEDRKPALPPKPLVVESIPSTPASTIKPAPVASDAKEDRKPALPPKPILSFAEIDHAIDSGQLVKAESLLKQLILNNPDSAAAHFRLAQIFAKEDRYAESREQLNKAKEIDPSVRFTTKTIFQALNNEVVAMEKMSKLPPRRD